MKSFHKAFEKFSILKKHESGHASEIFQQPAKDLFCSSENEQRVKNRNPIQIDFILFFSGFFSG